MSRFSALGWGTMLVCLLATACGEKAKTDEQSDSREAQLQKARQLTSDLKSQTDSLRQRINSIATHIGEDQRRLEERLREIDDLHESLVTLTLTAERFDTLRAEQLGQSEAEAKREARKGWPWPVYLILAFAVVVIVMVFKRLNRDEDLDEEPAEDEGFVEENDLGSIRYPGKRTDPGAKDPD